MIIKKQGYFIKFIQIPEYPPIKLYYWDKSVLFIGKETIDIENVSINIYDIEKSICDLVKFRNKVGKDILNEILNSYIKRKDKNLEKLFYYAKRIRIEKVIKNYLDVLV